MFDLDFFPHVFSHICPSCFPMFFPRLCLQILLQRSHLFLQLLGRRQIGVAVAGLAGLALVEHLGFHLDLNGLGVTVT